MFSLLFVVHNCRNEAIYITKSDFCFINIFFIYNPKLCINQAIKVTKSDFFYLFLFSNVFTLIVVHNCRNGEINVSYVTKFFYKHFLVCNPKFCINPCSAAPGCIRIAEMHPTAAPGCTRE